MKVLSAWAGTLLTVALLSFSLSLSGQVISGNLVGTIFDPAGATIPEAKVTATNVDTGVQAETTATSAGNYRLQNLPAGTYTLLVESPGFARGETRGVNVPLNQTVTANFNLKIGQASTAVVEVTEAAVAIDTTTAQIQNTFSTKQSTDLPVASNGAGVLNLSLLSAGVAQSDVVGAGTGPSVGGQRPRNNNFTVEGIDNNNKSVTGPLVTVPNDDVAEFTLLSNQFSPEYGHSTGGQFNTVVKSGTNEFHGMLYDYNRNRNFNAIDNLIALSGATTNPRYDQNRLGANFGGPILRNKLFFFTAFEYNPLGQNSTPGLLYAPTSAGYTTLGGVPGLSANNLKVLQQFLGTAPSAAAPALLPNSAYPVVGGKTIESGQVPVVAPNFTNTYYGVSSVDYDVSDKDKVRGRFIYNSVDQIDNAAALPIFYATLPFRYYLVNLSEFHNFSPNVSNEFRLGFNRYSNTTSSGSVAFPGLSQFPNLTIDEYQVNIGPDPNAPSGTIVNTYQLTDNLSVSRGKHTFTVGFNGERFISPQTFTQRVRGDYEWSSLQNYLTDQVPDVFGERSAGDVVYYGNQWQIGAFANDDWKIRSNLTINLGLRWEVQTTPEAGKLQALNAVSNVPGLISFNNPTYQQTNFQPRVGFAYSPGTLGNTSIRGGFGITYDTLFDNLDILSLPPQLQQTNDVGNANLTLSAPFLGQGGLPSSPVTLDPMTARNNTGGYIPNQVQPKALTWNFGFQHVFAQDYTFEARYVGTRGTHLPIQDRINISSPVSPTSSLPTFLSMPSQATLDTLPLTLASLKAQGHYLPQYLAAGFTSNITAYEPVGNSIYHALDLQLNKRLSKGLQFIGAYTWSHNIDDSTAEVFSTLTTPRRAQDFQNLRAERSDSALDHRQRVSMEVLYDVPFFRGSNWLLKNVVGNWEVAPIYTYQAGGWVTTQSGLDSNLNGDSYGDRTVVNASGAAGVGSAIKPLTNTAGATVGYVALNPNARYIQAGPGVYPNAGRNTLQLPPMDDIDITAVKRFSITERYKLEFQVQALNALNHPQYVGGFLNDVGTVTTGLTGNDVRQFLNPASSTFNKPSSVFGSNPRNLIFVAKFIF
ncbi:MAG: carboxypeptidase regulatory-like domain-containing protein [Acidobacteriota bacterium]|nr:carboxypeptidase regulatory-like domain-containing protein [Acidobacteriota bacterium]